MTWAPWAEICFFHSVKWHSRLSLAFHFAVENGNDLPISENDVILWASFHASPTSSSTIHDSWCFIKSRNDYSGCILAKPTMIDASCTQNNDWINPLLGAECLKVAHHSKRYPEQGQNCVWQLAEPILGPGRALGDDKWFREKEKWPAALLEWKYISLSGGEMSKTESRIASWVLVWFRVAGV